MFSNNKNLANSCFERTVDCGEETGFDVKCRVNFFHHLLSTCFWL